MTTNGTGLAEPATGVESQPARPLWRHLVRLARPKQWSKSVFVLVGPLYGFTLGNAGVAVSVVGAVIAFALASSGCYVVNDIADREADRLHPRKRRRPIASGAVGVPLARGFAAALLLGAAVGVLMVRGFEERLWLAGFVALYVVNVMLYSALLKHLVILDVISLAAGFVLRVLGGCAAAGVEPSSWLLNVTFFLSMFLAFGKRLGERRTLGDDARGARGVQAVYTDDLLRMAVVVTGVATLLTYGQYVVGQEAYYTSFQRPAAGSAHAWGFNLLWLTLLPATYALLRCIVLLEKGRYDDPTELATKDRPFQVAGLAFAVLTVVLVRVFRF